MSKLCVRGFGISLDGFCAGPQQDLNNPMGIGGMALHEWLFPTRMFKRMIGQDGGETGVDNDFAERGFENIGASIMGRNMFGPVRGPWTDDSWKGWWGANPPFHTPVFVLTNHPRKPLEMEGGTTFFFVTDGIHSALEQAVRAAQGKDVRLGGGANTVRQYLQTGLVDEMHLAVAPVLLGSGENLFAQINLPKLGYQCTERVSTAKATHIIIRKRD